MSKSDTILVVLDPFGADSRAAAVGGAGDARVAVALGGEVRRVTWPADQEVDFDSLAAALADHVHEVGALAVLVQDTDSGRQLASVLAHRLGTGSLLGCSDVVVRGDKTPPARGSAARGGLEPPMVRALTSADIVFVKTVYGDWLEREVTAADGFVPVMTLDLEGSEAPEEAANEAGSEGAPVAADLRASEEPETVAYAAPPVSRIRHLETIPPDPRSVDLAHAKRIVAAGMGSVGDDLLAAVHELANLLEGSVGATRPVVDEGYLPKERLIGQTGKTVAPELYLALGISGSPHHVAGVRRADRVLSVNRDVRAPIFQFSDVGYVADLEAVLPELIARIKQWLDAPVGDRRVE